MEDLLNEKDFIDGDYKPWRRFILFTALAFCSTQSVFWPMRQDTYVLPDYIIVAMITIIFLLMPVTLCVVMVLSKKEMLALKKSTIAWGVAALCAGCYASFTLCLIISEGSHFLDDDFNLIIPGIIYPVLYLICIAVVLPAINRRRKNTP